MLKFICKIEGEYMSSNISEDKNKVKKSEKVDIRKYINCVLLMISVVLVVFIGFKMYQRFQNGKLGESVLERTVGSIQYEDIDSAIREMPEDGFVFISFVKNSQVNKLENGLKKVIIENGLQSNFYYLDATDLKLDKEFINSINSKFKLEGNKVIEELPAILYFRDGKHTKTLSSTETRMLSVDDFSKLLDSYEIIESARPQQ